MVHHHGLFDAGTSPIKRQDAGSTPVCLTGDSETVAQRLEQLRFRIASISVMTAIFSRGLTVVGTSAQ